MIHTFGYTAPMSSCFVDCWKCDDCGFRWIKTEAWPERCASSKCRSRKWNQKGEVNGPDLQREGTHTPREGARNTHPQHQQRKREPMPTLRNSEAHEERLHSLQSVREELANERSTPIPGVSRGFAGLEAANTTLPISTTTAADSDLPMCSYIEYDPDTGETYGCTLHQHPSKVKHQRGSAI